MFTALMAPFALLLGLGPLIRWRRDDVARQIKRLIIALVVTLSLSLALPVAAAGPYHRHGGHRPDDGPVGADLRPDGGSRTGHPSATASGRGLRTLTRSQWGMVLGHVGVAVTVIGITFSQNYSVERDVRMRPGDSIDIHRYHFVFNGVRNIVGPNWTGGEGIIAVTRNGRRKRRCMPRSAFTPASRMMMTEAAIQRRADPAICTPALGEELSDGSWAVRLYYKPFVRWIWYGGVLMALGGLCCMLDPRYRMRKKLQEAS
ncbi:cytochrome c heme lyase subunit CcmF [Klebsiella variicola]|uniref:Cytochrome c heme lyase subunit CcmF n=1 Tax=Klebsiella variicola TaxID=244366 RepID=A0A7H4MLT6_KLEVA|nr:cytochrome c heme lyase subunit CcmF [Klebsiella variicola]